jgi:hypothetical protein
VLAAACGGKTFRFMVVETLCTRTVTRTHRSKKKRAFSSRFGDQQPTDSKPKDRCVCPLAHNPASPSLTAARTQINNVLQVRRRHHQLVFRNKLTGGSSNSTMHHCSPLDSIYHYCRRAGPLTMQSCRTHVPSSYQGSSHDPSIDDVFAVSTSI